MSTHGEWKMKRRSLVPVGLALGLAMAPACAPDRRDPEPIAATSDPLIWTALPPLFASDETSYDRFGAYVALSGETLVAGTAIASTADTVATYVFVRSGVTWNQQAILPSPSEAKRGVGGAVAISGDTIVVGVDDDDKGPHTGAAYVFTRSGATWTEQARLLASDAATLTNFGVSVAIAGDTMVAGSSRNGVKGAAAGAAYVFSRSGESWSQQQQLLADDGMSDDLFGTSTALSKDTIVIGAPASGAATGGPGAAYVFARSGASWSLQQELIPEDGRAADGFGRSVAIEGDTIIVGAFRADHDSSTVDSGSAYVFARSGASWSLQQKLTAASPTLGEEFGVGVALSSDAIVVGASGDGTRPGSAYVFARSGATWEQQAQLVAPNMPQYNHFGVALAVEGDTILAGASYDNRLGTQAGAVYPFALRRDVGQPCTDGGQCGSSFCVDAVCCYSVCNDLGVACSAAKKGSGVDGICGPIPSVDDPSASDTTTTGDAAQTGSGAGGASSDVKSYYTCQATPRRVASSWPASLVVVALAFAARSRRRRPAATTRSSAGAR